MMYSWSAFQEPRGVMRILQFIFAICAFATTTNFIFSVTQQCDGKPPISYEFEYPFRIEQNLCMPQTPKDNNSYAISADVSSDAQFFVATGILSLMYCIFVIVVYSIVDELYRAKPEIPLADFMLTTILAIFWLAASAAWSNGTNALKGVTEPSILQDNCKGCAYATTSFSRLNISLILGFLNFFLWASDLWFLYKETPWFQGRSVTQPQGINIPGENEGSFGGGPSSMPSPPNV